MRQVHDGTDTGPVWQWIITLAGLAPAVLGVSGVVMWLRRRARRQRLAEA
jgi:LPXTG-motif cell wall-anchored protein